MFLWFQWHIEEHSSIEQETCHLFHANSPKRPFLSFFCYITPELWCIAANISSFFPAIFMLFTPLIQMFNRFCGSILIFVFGGGGGKLCVWPIFMNILLLQQNADCRHCQFTNHISCKIWIERIMLCPKLLLHTTVKYIYIALPVLVTQMETKQLYFC